MIKRPKPGDTEDDLLEFQRQFLAEKSKPSAHVVAKPGDKRKTSDGASCNTKHEKDVVHIEDLPEEQPRTHQTSAAKKSRFKTLQDEKKQHARGPTDHATGDVIDDLDTSTATVLTKIIERDTRNVPVQMVSPVTLQCPVVEDQSSQISKPKEKKRKSLFAQRFAENPSQFGSFPSPDSLNHSKDVEMQESVQSVPSSVVEGMGLSATFGKMEVEKIHRENEERLAKMSDTEIIEEQQKLLQTLDPKLVDFLKSRKSAKPQVVEQKKVEEFDSPTAKKTKKSKGSVDTDIPVTVKKEWLNMNKIEYDKLEWMKDLPPPSAGDSKSGQQARFDFKGNILSPDADIPVNAGLHHHGDEPERAGYTLGELFQLARSSSIPQRTLALQVLSRVITQAKEGNLAELIETPVLPSILDAGVVFLLRWALDDSTPAVVLAAVAALNALLVNQADEMMLGHVFHWGQGHRVASQAPSEPEEQGLKLPDVSDEKAEETDAEVAKKDLILALVSRMCLLQRLKYILEVTRPQVPSVVGILQILTRIARHSPTLAYQVSSCPGLLDFIVKEFLPISWKLADITQPLSSVYGVPLSHAMVLVRTICQSGRNITASLVSKYDLTGLLTRYLAVPVRDLNLPLAEAYRLQIECLNTWKVCLCYGFTDTVYLDLYNVIVDELRTGPKITEDDSLAETKLTALIGALEAVLCVASVERRLKGFKQAQDGSSMETERSEDVPIATLNWSHVADLIQPIRILLTNWLAKIATTYHMRKSSLQIPSACLNFLITYYSRCQAQLSSSEILAVLEEMEAVYKTIIQHWNSQGFVSLRSAISQHSNILRGNVKNMEEMSCLPEYGQCTLQGKANIAVTMNSSPFNFLCSYIHLVFTICKEHKGILTQDTKQDPEAVTLPSAILQCEHLLLYLKKVAQGNTSHLQSNYFTKFEYHLQYYFLKLAMLPAHEDVLKTLDKKILHSVALFQLTGLLYGDEHLIHDLLSTVVYQPTFWQCTPDEKASVHISNLSLSESIPTQIKSATEQEIGFKQEDLEKEALANLLNIRSTYLAALQHFQKPLLQSRHHFMRNVDSVNSCFTSNINESLMPKDWMYMPLIELYNEYSSIRSEVQNVLSTTQVVMVSSVLQWIYLLETYRPVVMNSISITMKITRIMCTFLTGNDMFLDRRVYCFLAGLLRQYCKPNLLDKIDFTQTIPGLSSFYDMYISLLQEYEAVSFGDWLFGCYIFIPLQQRHSLQYRKAIWTEYTGILRILGVPPSKLLIPINQFLEPEETNVELLRLYFQSLIGCKLRYSWSPVLYLMAIHHVNRFMYTQDGSHKELKKSMMSAILKSNNEELKHHILYYKRVDISQDLGMEFYTELPQIRQKLVTSVTSS